MERHTGSVQHNQGDTGRALTLRECSGSVHLSGVCWNGRKPHNLLKVNREGKPKVPSRAAIGGKSKSRVWPVNKNWRPGADWQAAQTGSVCKS